MRLGIENLRRAKGREESNLSSVAECHLELLSRVLLDFEIGCNVIFDNVLIRRDLFSVGAFATMVSNRGNYRV